MTIETDAGATTQPESTDVTTRPTDTPVAPTEVKATEQDFGQGPKDITLEKGPVNELPEPQDLNLVDIDELDDPLVKSLHTQIVGQFPNFDFNKAVGDAFANGDKAFINQYYLHEVAGVAAPILQAQLERIFDSRVNYTTDLVSKAHKAAGGEKEWAKATALFKAKAPAHTQRVVKGLVDSSSPEAHLEAVKYIVDYTRMAGLVDTKVSTQAGSNAGAANPITHSEYLKGLSEAHKIQNPTARQEAKLELARKRYAVKGG